MTVIFHGVLISPCIHYRSLRVRVDGKLSEEVGVNSGVPQGSVLGPLLFLVYVNDIWTNIESNLRLFDDDCILYRRINDASDTDKLQTDLNKLEAWGLENEMIINPGKINRSASQELE
jgi:hypothetical protein